MNTRFSNIRILSSQHTSTHTEFWSGIGRLVHHIQPNTSRRSSLNSFQSATETPSKFFNCEYVKRTHCMCSSASKYSSRRASRFTKLHNTTHTTNTRRLANTCKHYAFDWNSLSLLLACLLVTLSWTCKLYCSVVCLFRAHFSHTFTTTEQKHHAVWWL